MANCACSWHPLRVAPECTRHQQCTCATEDAGDGFTWQDEGLLCLWCRAQQQHDSYVEAMTS